MSDKILSLRGMKDLFGKDFELHQYIIDSAQKLSSLYCYKAISTPILEYTKIFFNTLGDTSDVVNKEMYTFLDKKGESITLRPEFTAGIMRAFISNGLQQNIPLKLFSYGPVFRYDRPQKGRHRQFHQINYEHIGSNEPYSDAESIKLAIHLLQDLGLLNEITLEINSLGCYNSRNLYQDALINYFLKYENELSDDSKVRLRKKPLRILDSKDEKDKKIINEAPFINNYYTLESRVYFDKVLNYLSILNINFRVNTRLVRGLDYYCHTVFEFLHDKSKTQNAIGGGGRYNYLSKLLKIAETPAVGLGLGVERLALMLSQRYTSKKISPVYLIPINNECEEYIIKLANFLRLNSIPVTITLKGKIEKRIKKALKEGCIYAVFAGINEMQDNSFRLKLLDKKEEKKVSSVQLLDILLKARVQ